MDRVIVSNHAYERLRKRCGFNKNAAERMADKAYQAGLSYRETRGVLKGYMTELYRKYRCQHGKAYKVYGDFVYCFVVTPVGATVLVTVLDVPNDVKHKSLCSQRSYRERNRA